MCDYHSQKHEICIPIQTFASKCEMSISKTTCMANLGFVYPNTKCVYQNFKLLYPNLKCLYPKFVSKCLYPNFKLLYVQIRNVYIQILVSELWCNIRVKIEHYFDHWWYFILEYRICGGVHILGGTDFMQVRNLDRMFQEHFLQAIQTLWSIILCI